MSEMESKYVVINSEGCVLCNNKDTIEFKNLSEVNKDNVFFFWCCKLEEFKSFIDAFGAFKEINPFKSINIDNIDEGISFLEAGEDNDGNLVFF